MRPVWDLKYFRTEEWGVVQERLKNVPDGQLCPAREDMFNALYSINPEDVKVVIFGQDPYPTLRHATGIAFDIPLSISRDDWPPTLKNIMKEYEDDLHYPIPAWGSLRNWVDQGVLLWNVIPTCTRGRSLSHNWDEWKPLTKEIIEVLNKQGGVVMIFLGTTAKEFVQYVDDERTDVIITSHPSPRGSKHGFCGSRIFSIANAYLAKTRGIVDWKL